MSETALEEDDDKKLFRERYCVTLQFSSPIEENKCAIRRVLEKDIVRVVADLNHFWK